MVKIETLFNQKKISRILETEKERYLNFFSKSYKENLEHCKFNLEKFPRWSIISGYYAMHDIAKLFLADKFDLKIDFNVHKTVVNIFKEIIKDKELIKMLEFGLEEFEEMLNDLVLTRKKRIKVQYYTGSEFMHEKYKKEAKNFLKNYVLPFIEKIGGLADD